MKKSEAKKGIARIHRKHNLCSIRGGIKARSGLNDPIFRISEWPRSFRNPGMINSRYLSGKPPVTSLLRVWSPSGTTKATQGVPGD